jgi:hypothetical protein
MQLPLVAPAPVFVEHAQVFRELFENRCQFQHFENYLTGLMVLANKSMANISRCLLESADKTNLARFFSEAPWEQEKVNEKRITYRLEQTVEVRRKAEQSCVIVDDTLCEHVGSMFGSSPPVPVTWTREQTRHFDGFGQSVVALRHSLSVRPAGASRASCEFGVVQSH